MSQQHDEITLRAPMAESEKTSTLEWTRPDQVMQLYRMKLKKRVLQARINKTNVSKDVVQGGNLDGFTSGSNALQHTNQKRKNPFAINETCKKQRDVTSGLEISSDNTLFALLNIDVQSKKQTTNATAEESLNFVNVLSKLESNVENNAECPKGAKHLPIDWTLKTKMRFTSPKPFPWSSKLKTSEEASGTTGFVRCLNIGDKETTLDTSLNARFDSCLSCSLIFHLTF